MRTYLKRVVTMLLVLAMILTMLPAAVAADELYLKIHLQGISACVKIQ